MGGLRGHRAGNHERRTSSRGGLDSPFFCAACALKRTREAYTNLACVAEKFPGNWSIPYNLACYCSQLGRLQEAQDWFKKAVVIDDKIVPKTAINDPDLKPLWDSMSTTNWKKNE